jgi:hypothetical protein
MRQEEYCYILGFLGNMTYAPSCILRLNCCVTEEMQQTHCYATGTVMLLWKCNRVHRSCYQGNLICNNIMSGEWAGIWKEAEGTIPSSGQTEKNHEKLGCENRR